MPKLTLKETPAEAAERQWRKSQRAARKKRKDTADIQHNHDRSPSPRQWRLSTPEIYHVPLGFEYLYSNGGNTEGPEPPPTQTQTPLDGTGHKIDFKQIRAEMEDARFRSKLFDAMDDDMRLESIESAFNDYHVPARWRNSDGTGSGTASMDDEEYAEWIRREMWKKTHRVEEEEREKERKLKKERERRERKEMERLGKQREQRRAEKERKKITDAFEAYQMLWKSLTSSPPTNIRFSTLPWPIYPPPTSPADLTREAISSFILSPLHSTDKTRKQRLREALLAYHPDRFMGKWMSCIHSQAERELVKEAIEVVTRALNSLAESE